MYHNFILTLTLGICCFFSLSQELKYTENKDKKEIVKYTVPDDKALLIFQTDLELTFEASNDPLKSIVKEDGKYKVTISIGSQLVTIISRCCGRKMFNFVYNELGALKSKEIRYFIIEKSKIVGFVVDITKEEINKGTSDFPSYNEKDGYLIFYTSNIPKVEIQFKEKNAYITKVVKEPDRYRINAKSGVPIELIITAKGYDEMSYFIDPLDIKGVKYFRLFSLTNFEETKSSDNTLKKGSYKIITFPVGALVEIDGNPYFNKQREIDRKTPLQLDGYNAGTLKIFITLNKYEKVIDTIYVGGQKNVSEYKLIPTFSLIRFNISPSNVDIFIDGEKKMTNFSSEIEVPKGVRFIEIKSKHYYSESFNLQTFANQTHNVNKKLLPIIGYLTITPDLNADKAICYIESNELGIAKYKIGTLPIKEITLQEGEYIINIEKKGFASKEKSYKINIAKGDIARLTVKMVDKKEVMIITKPEGANVYIDDDFVGKSNVRVDIGIGKHKIKIEKENYEVINDFFDIMSKTENYSFSLDPKLLKWDIRSQKLNKGSEKIYINGIYRGHGFPTTLMLPEGKYFLEIKDEKDRTIFKAKVKHPISKTIKFPLYGKNGATLLSGNCFFPSTLQEYSFFPFYFYGFTITALKFMPYTIDTNKFISYSPFLNLEFRMGGAIFRHLDMTILGKIDYSSNFGENTQDKSNNRDNFDLTRYFYGIELTTRSNYGNIYLQFGVLNYSVEYKFYIKNINKYGPSITFNKNYGFGISAGISIINMFETYNNVLRLWYKPFFDNLVY